MSLETKIQRRLKEVIELYEREKRLGEALSYKFNFQEKLQHFKLAEYYGGLKEELESLIN